MSQTFPEHSAKRLARLAAVQGLYQVALTHRPAKDIVKDFCDHPAGLLQELIAGEEATKVDQDLFSSIVEGVTQNEVSLDELVAGALNAKVSADRVEVLLRAILRAGAFELLHHGSTAAGVIINDYVDVTHAFFGAKEPGLVNAVLDKMSKNLRG